MKPDKKFITLILTFLGIGLVGSVMFFPVNMDSQYTCLFHRLVHEGHSYAYPHDTIVQHYITTFGFLWWGSLILLAGSIYAWKLMLRAQGNPPEMHSTSIGKGASPQ